MCTALVLVKASSMNRIFKMVGSIVLSVALFCSGVSGVLLRCSHERHSSLLAESELQDHHPQGSDVPEIACVESDYRIVLLGAASFLYRLVEFLHRVPLGISSEASASFEPNSSWLNSFLGLFAPFRGLSRHLFLSVLRI